MASELDFSCLVGSINGQSRCTPAYIQPEEHLLRRIIPMFPSGLWCTMMKYHLIRKNSIKNAFWYKIQFYQITLIPTEVLHLLYVLKCILSEQRSACISFLELHWWKTKYPMEKFWAELKLAHEVNSHGKNLVYCWSVTFWWNGYFLLKIH